VWWEGESLKKYNSWLVEQNMTPLPQHGWYVGALGAEERAGGRAGKAAALVFGSR
jgi:hypothetical protein